MIKMTRDEFRKTRRLLPLSLSIARELAERLDALDRLEEQMLELGLQNRGEEMRLVASEAVQHYREVRRVQQELEDLENTTVDRSLSNPLDETKNTAPRPEGRRAV